MQCLFSFAFFVLLSISCCAQKYMIPCISLVDENKTGILKINITNQQPDPELYTLHGEIFVTVDFYSEKEDAEGVPFPEFNDVYDNTARLKVVNSSIGNRFFLENGMYDERLFFLKLKEANRNISKWCFGRKGVAESVFLLLFPSDVIDTIISNMQKVFSNCSEHAL